MGDRTAIEWTDASWNPVAGCTRVSAGCDNCYAAALAAGRLKNTPTHRGLAVVTAGGRAAFNGKIRLLPDRLDQPLRWRAPRRIFVNSMSDLFHEEIPDEFIERVFGVMAAAERHTFQVLTKRPERMRDHCGERFKVGLPNVWLGVSVEDQGNADARIPLLLQTPAAVRFLSCEPLLGPIQLRQSWRDFLQGWDVEPVHVCGGDLGVCSQRCPEAQQYRTDAVDWVIVGGESGHRPRAMDPAWATSLRDQCVSAGVPFFFKQWGGRTPKAGGRELDGMLWDQMPVAPHG